MSSNIVQCDQCGKVVKMQEAHGWLEVKVYMTKPTQEQYDAYMQHPQAAAHVIANDIRPAPLPPMVYGDFCSMDCIVKFYKEQNSVRQLVEEGAAQADSDGVKELDVMASTEVPLPVQYGDGGDQGDEPEHPYQDDEVGPSAPAPPPPVNRTDLIRTIHELVDDDPDYPDYPWDLE
jgi:hypothetical protein